MITKLLDFSSYNPQIYDELLEEISKLDVGVLINNVGINTSARFKNLQMKTIKKILAVNCLPAVILTQSILQ